MAEQVAKLKKKQWYPIIAPKQFDNIVLGETPVYDPKAMIGKTLSCSLMNLINDVRRQNISIHFKVVDVDGGKAKTSIIGYQIVPSTVKRFVRRSSEKIDISFTCETADNVFLRVKPLIVTKSDVKGSVAAKLRGSVINFLIKSIKKMTYEEVLNDLMSHKMQSAMRDALHKIYPLKICEIRYAGIESREKKEEPKELKGVKEESKEEVKAGEEAKA